MGLKEFKEKVLSDVAFAEKAKEIRGLEEMVEFAKKEGFTFTIEDIKNDTELSDNEIDKASGGASIVLRIWIGGGAYFIS